MRHGLTAETIIVALEDAEDYRVFEATIIADYDAQSAMERELVLRLANLLWRLRRATTMETGLFEKPSERAWVLQHSALGNWFMLCSSRVHWSVMTRCPRALAPSPNAPLTLLAIQSSQLRARSSQPIL